MSDNVRVYEIAEEAGATSSEVIAKACDLGIELKSPQSAVSFEDAEEIANYIMTGKSSKIEKKPEVKKVKKAAPKKEEVKVETAKVEAVTEAPKVKEVKTVKEEPKVETAKEEAAPVEKTPAEEPKVEEPKVEEVQEAPVKKNNKIIPKRRGLKIIKKKKPKIEPVEEISNEPLSTKKQMKSLSEILGNASSDDSLNKQVENTTRPKVKK